MSRADETLDAAAKVLGRPDEMHTGRAIAQAGHRVAYGLLAVAAAINERRTIEIVVPEEEGENGPDAS